MLKKLLIGVDPSINSTGVCISVLDENNEEIETKFYIIKPEPLRKKDIEIADNYSANFLYITYNKECAEENHAEEISKIHNFREIIEQLKELINKTDKRFGEYNDIYLCQEGISYGSSIKTKSVFDLAGLNFLLRNMACDMDIKNLLIATPSEIKKFATGKGNANKLLILEEFNKIYDFEKLPKIDDIADAYFMKQYLKEIYYDELN